MFPPLWIYLDDNLQGFDLLVGGPRLLQGLVQLFDAVGIILLGQVQQLSLGTLSTHRQRGPNNSFNGCVYLRGEITDAKSL